MDKIRASTSILGTAISQLGGGFETVGSVMQGFAAGGVAGAVVAATGEIVQGLKWAVGQASEAEQAVKNLSIAVEKSGTAWDSVKEGTLSALSELQKFTVYSDEQLAATLQRLLTFGMSYDEAMTALGTATDLAAAKNMDLQRAADIVGKAFMGNTAILQRYGIDVTTSREATAALKDAISIVADAIKRSGENLQGFSSTLEEAGVSLTTTEGKMRGAKDIAEELVGAFQTGEIDAEAFAEIMGELGVTIDTTKLKASDFPAVMASLNEQFGGTAQEQAKTYVGIQERFKNAVSDLGEKVGGILLPALSGITEAMIPAVDWFEKGVDAVQAWLTEVAKMPEVKGAMDALGEAFSGFMKYLDELWNLITTSVGPALEELWSAFKDLWDALSPIGEALGEIFSAISGGGEGLDFFKVTIQAIAFEIRGFAELIKLAAPYIRQFADAFKAAADFIAPILVQIRDGIVGFLDAVKNAFQGFYTWLVGGSLWQDMWNALLALTSEALGKLVAMFTDQLLSLSGVLQKVWDQLQVYLGQAIDQIQKTLGEGWDTIYQKAVEVWDMIQKRTAEITQAIGDFLGQTWQTISTNTAQAMGGVKDTVTEILFGIQTAFSESFLQIQDLFTTSLTNVQFLWDTAWNQIQQIGLALFQIITGDLQGFAATTQMTMTNLGTGVQTATTSAWTGVQNAVSGALTTMGTGISNFWKWLVGGSVWPENLKVMMVTTQQASTQIQSIMTQMLINLEIAFQSYMTRIAANFQMKLQQMVQAAQAAAAQIMSIMAMAQASYGGGSFAYGSFGYTTPAAVAPTIIGGAAPAYSESAPVLTTSTAVTLPVTVQVDGATVARTVEQRMIQSQEIRGRVAGRA